MIGRCDETKKRRQCDARVSARVGEEDERAGRDRRGARALSSRTRPTTTTTTTTRKTDHASRCANERRAQTERRRRSTVKGAIARAVRGWRPHRTPRLTTTVLLYVVGLYVAFYARPPVEITPAMRRRYEEALLSVDSELGESLRRANVAYLESESEFRAMTPFGWRFTASSSARAEIERARQRRRAAEESLAREEKKRQIKMREARSQLGLWSELGVGDAKALFRRSYERGKVFATRSTFWDGLSLMLRGKSDESTLSFFLRWMMIALSNFTVGMMSAIFSFAFSLPGLISSFATGAFSAVAFYCVALVAAISVVATTLLLLYGGAAGGTYALVAYAGPALARLDAAEERRRARIGYRHRAGAAMPPREHMD